MHGQMVLVNCLMPNDFTHESRKSLGLLGNISAYFSPFVTNVTMVPCLVPNYADVVYILKSFVWKYLCEQINLSQTKCYSFKGVK